MNQTNNRIRDEWREQIEIWNDTLSPENEGEATEIVTNWWLSKIDELLKSQRAELVEKIEKKAYCLLDRDGKFVDFEDIISLMKEE
jgi:hypothetical protein